MSAALKIGCVGTSGIMDIITDSLRQTAGMEAAVIYSRDQERGQAYARKAGIAEATSDYEEMIRRDDLDVIYIASPNYIHARQAIAAMEAGKDVIVEKPAGICADELDRMYAAARKNDVFFLEATTTLFMPGYLRMKELLPGLGKLSEAELRYGQYSTKYDAYLAGRNPNIFNPLMKTGALNDMGIYCVHAAVDLFGKPEETGYEAKYGPNGIDLEGVLTLQYPDLTVTVRTAKNRQPDGGSGCRITGEHGWFEQQGPFNEFDHAAAQIDGKDIQIPDRPAGNRMCYEHAAFRDCFLKRDREMFERMAYQSAVCAGILETAHRGDALGV